MSGLAIRLNRKRSLILATLSRKLPEPSLFPAKKYKYHGVKKYFINSEVPFRGNRMMRSWQKICLIVLGGFFWSYLAVAVSSGLIVTKWLIPKLRAVSNNVRSHHKEILSDLKLLDAKPIFASPLRKKDAQNFISRHIGWKGAKVESVVTPKREDLIALKTAYPELAVENLKKLADDPRTITIDVSWVDQIESYDHWNLASSSIVKVELERVKKLNGIARIGVLAEMPIPDYSLFQFASVIRFLQLQKSGDPLKSFRLFRHASYLAHTTHTIAGAMIATAGLRREHLFAETFKITDWTLIEKERIAAYKRVSWVWGGLIHEARWGTLPEEFQMYIKPHNGVCAMAGESLFYSGFQDFFVPTVPFETNFSAQLQRSEGLTQKLFDVCSMPQYLVFLAPSPASSNSLFGRGYSIGINLARIPFMRRMFGITLMTVGTPNHLRYYEERSPAENKSAANPKGN